MTKPALRPWFAPKRYGYGAGLPVSWEGWVSLIVFLAATFGAAVLIRDLTSAAVAIGILAIGFIALTYRKTAGGWRWRWGDRD